MAYKFKDGDKEAKATLYFVLKNFAKLLAPFAPFSAEDIWKKLKTDSDEESVHLSEWPTQVESRKLKVESIIVEMQNVRSIVNVALKERQKAGVAVRQPLNTLKVKSEKLKDEYVEILKDELNVKNVEFVDEMENEVELDFEITPQLKKEGDYRELLRAVQDMRKRDGLMPSDVVTLGVSTDTKGQELIKEFETEFKKIVGAKEINLTDNDGEEIKIDELVFVVKIEK